MDCTIQNTIFLSLDNEDEVLQQVTLGVRVAMTVALEVRAIGVVELEVESCCDGVLEVVFWRWGLLQLR